MIPHFSKIRRTFFIIVFGLLIWTNQFLIPVAGAQNSAVPFPKLNIEFGSTTNPKEVNSTIQIFLLLTVLSLAPSILIMVTSFTRIIIVLSFLRQAVGTRQAPPNQLLVAFALFLTYFTMAPVFNDINEHALQPYLQGQIEQSQAFDNTIQPLRKFMFKQTRKKDLALYVQIAKLPRPRNELDIPTEVLIPAFITSELKTSFQMGFALFIPFLVIDIVISSLLMSMGMMMLPPIMISTPFKILLFILADGWNLVVKSLITSFY